MIIAAMIVSAPHRATTGPQAAPESSKAAKRALVLWIHP